MEKENNTDNPFSNDFGVARPSTESMEDVYAFKNRLLEAIEHRRDELDEENEANEITHLKLMEMQKLDKIRRIKFEKRSRVCKFNIDRFIARRKNQSHDWLQPFLVRIEKQYTELKTDVKGLKTDVKELFDVGELKTGVGELKTGVGELKTNVKNLRADVGELKTDIGELKTDVNESKTTVTNVNLGLKKVQLSTAISENSTRRMNCQPLLKVPFIIGEGPDEDAPVIQSLEMIDHISKDDCEYMLRGYGVSFSTNQNTYLKYRLRDVLGFDQASDLRFIFHPFE